MAKILVADDNSNIQRMVGLALKDQGIDVVAVGNGEAAVRKISEIRPDLVLADVFMPVRNGYEVCQYVKEDPSLKHIPVILLVGAFDPLDEQEAQRVGADGVLKKPFVPPDPLIVMVKAALQKAGVSLGSGGREKSPAATPRKSADVLPFTASPLAGLVPPPAELAGSPLGGLSFSRPSPPEMVVTSNESFVDAPAAPEPVRIDAGEQTMAFGDLLGPTTVEETEFVSSYEPEKNGAGWSELDEPNEVPEEEEEEASKSAPSWRREEGTTASGGEDESRPVQNWRDLPMMHTTGRKSARETWEETEDKGGFVTAAEVPGELGAFGTEISALEGESLNAKTQEANVAETPVEEAPQTGFLEQTETFSSDESAVALAEETEFSTAESADQRATGNASTVGEVANEVVSEPLPEIAHLEEAARRQEVARQDAAARQEEIDRQEEIALQEEVARQEEIARQEEAARQAEIAQQEEIARQAEVARQAEAAQQKQRQAEPEPEPVNSWFSRPASPWDSDAKRSNPWAAALESKPGTAEGETARTATISGSASSQGGGNTSSDALATVISDLSAAEVSSTQPTAAQAEVDAMVAKVLSKLSPEVLQAVTRELLKPVIAALVEDELKSKK
ncbi:MAG TPA: response regulator [Candidatus Acidoferrales bacterium]|nr:response regulator [Candidatus Acidoferrales bacterium]